MAVDRKVMERLLGRVAIVFPLPTAERLEDLAEVWANLLNDCTEDELVMGLRYAMRTLTRFPYPADVLAVVSASKAPAGTD